MSRDGASSRILIVGAGPTGLTLALCLKAYGIDCDIWDVKPGPVDSSKALAINPLSTLQLDLLGFSNRVGKKALRVSRLDVSWQGRTRLNPVDLRHLDCPRNYFLIQPQYDTECDLLAALQAAGGQVAWRTSAISLQRSGATTLVAGVCAERGSFSQVYDYVIGCDGKRSVVREHIGATLAGTDYDMHLALGDFQLDWDAAPDRVHYFVYDDTFFVFVPLPRQRWRVVVKCDGAPIGPPRDSVITEAVGRHFGRNIFVGDSSWSSLAPLYVQVASKLQQGNVFIAGDAAHLYSPIGGTGMNTGMQDALNLGWRLACAVLGWADADKVLGEYERERMPVIAANAASTDLMTRLITCRPPHPESHLPFMPRMAGRALLRRHFPMSLSGIGLRYDSGHFNPGYAALLPLLQRIGQVDTPKVRAVAFCQSEKGLSAYGRLQRQCAGFAGVDCVLLMHDEYREQWKAMGAQPDTVQIMRPDGIVLHSGKLEDWQSAAARVAACLPRAAVQDDRRIEQGVLASVS